MKKCLAVLLMLMLTVSMFSGCGSKQEASKNEANSTEKESKKVEEKKEEKKVEEKKVEEKKEEKVEEEPAIDLKGRSIRFAAGWDISPHKDTPEHEELRQRKAEIEKKYNCKIEFSKDFNNELFTTSVLAGDPFADVVMMDIGFVYACQKKDLLYPFSDLKNIDLTNPKWDSTNTKHGTINGKVYAIREGALDPRGAFFYNKRMFEEAGLPDLLELQRKGEWTWDKLIEFSKKLTKDTDGDGSIDQWGIIDCERDMFYALLYSNGGEIAVKKDGNWEYALDSPESMQAAQTYDKIANKLNVALKRQEGDSWDWMMKRFRDGQAAMLPYQVFAAGSFKDMEDDFGCVFFPKPSADKDYVSVLTGMNIKVMPKCVKNPEDVAFIFDKYTEPLENETADTWKEHYYPRFRDAESVDETINDMVKGGKSLYPMGYAIAAGPVSDNVIFPLSNGSKTVAAAIEETKQLVENNIAEFFGTK